MVVDIKHVLKLKHGPKLDHHVYTNRCDVCNRIIEIPVYRKQSYAKKVTFQLSNQHILYIYIQRFSNGY